MDVKNIIQELGGATAAARFFEISQAAVSQWKQKNKIPQARLLHLKAARPDLFDKSSQDRAAA
jgi:DNA-binding transcriptional regulator YdaS (Cro superfamily)